MPQAAKRFVGTLDAALRKCEDSFFVQNNMSARGVLLISVKDSEGSKQTFRLPKTWVPIDLLTFTDKASLQKSTDLRAMVRRGFLAILDEESAKDVAGSPEAVEEAIRLGIAGEGVLAVNPNDSVDALDVVHMELVTEGAEDNETMGYIRNISTEIIEASSDDSALAKIKDMKGAFDSDLKGVNKEHTKELLLGIKEAMASKNYGRALLAADNFYKAI